MQELYLDYKPILFYIFKSPMTTSCYKYVHACVCIFILPENNVVESSSDLPSLDSAVKLCNTRWYNLQYECIVWQICSNGKKSIIFNIWWVSRFSLING